MMRTTASWLSALVRLSHTPDVRDDKSMNSKILLSGMTLISALLVSGCTSFMTNRGRDCADVFTATVGVGLGVTAQVGPAKTGLGYEMGGYGLRGGCFGSQVGPDYNPYTPNSFDYHLLFLGREAYLPHREIVKMRHKEFWSSSEAVEHFKESPTPFINTLPESRCPSYFTQIEATIGLRISFRVGFNPGELLDLCLGV